jgi:hypothetical protein
VRLSLDYRPGDDTSWRLGRTTNVSASGVLFEPDPAGGVLDLGVPIEMGLILPPEVVGSLATRIVCTGRIARTVAGTPTSSRIVAATIVNYRFQQGDKGGEA